MNECVSLPIDAIVLGFGVEEQSPRANTFEYLTCCSVSLSTSTYPASLVRSFASSNTCGADCGGTACKIEY